MFYGTMFLKTISIKINDQQQNNDLERIELSLVDKKIYTGQQLSKLKRKLWRTKSY